MYNTNNPKKPNNPTDLHTPKNTNNFNNPNKFNNPNYSNTPNKPINRNKHNKPSNPTNPRPPLYPLPYSMGRFESNGNQGECERSPLCNSVSRCVHAYVSLTLLNATNPTNLTMTSTIPSTSLRDFCYAPHMIYLVLCYFVFYFS